MRTKCICPGSLALIIATVWQKSKTILLEILLHSKTEGRNPDGKQLRKKICKNRRSGVDSHDKLWYSFVTARLVKSNQSCGGSCKTSEETPNSSIPFSFFQTEAAAWFALPVSGAAQDAFGTASCANEKQKRDARLDHLCAPIFVFAEKNVQSRRLRTRSHPAVLPACVQTECADNPARRKGHGQYRFLRRDTIHDKK